MQEPSSLSWFLKGEATIRRCIRKYTARSLHDFVVYKSLDEAVTLLGPPNQRNSDIRSPTTAAGRR